MNMFQSSIIKNSSNGRPFTIARWKLKETNMLKYSDKAKQFFIDVYLRSSWPSSKKTDLMGNEDDHSPGSRNTPT